LAEKKPTRTKTIVLLLDTTKGIEGSPHRGQHIDILVQKDSNVYTLIHAALFLRWRRFECTLSSETKNSPGLEFWVTPEEHELYSEFELEKDYLFSWTFADYDKTRPDENRIRYAPHQKRGGNTSACVTVDGVKSCK
jgi:hypothetical protein